MLAQQRRELVAGGAAVAVLVDYAEHALGRLRAGRRDGASRREEEVGQVLDGLGGLGAAELDKRRDERSSEDFLDVLIVSAPQLALHWRSSTRAPLRSRSGSGPARAASILSDSLLE